MGAGRAGGTDAGRASDGASDERVSSRLGPGRTRPTLGALGILVAALLVAALVAWPNLTGAPQTSPIAASSPGAVSSQIGPTPASPSETPTPSAVASELFVEPNLVDRPGVPSELYDKYWTLWGQAGHVGTTALLIKPPNEAMLGADAGRVASFVVDEETDEPLVGPDGVTITVRDLRTGATIRTFDSSILPTYGLAVGSLLFWTGYGIPRDPINPLDGGVWVADLADPASTPRAVVLPSDLAATCGPHADRGRLWLTEHGRTITTIVGGDTATATQIIDVSETAPPIMLDDESAFEISEGRALVVRAGRYRLLELTTGQPVGPGFENDLAYRSVAGDGEFFASFARDGDVVFAAIDLSTGEARDIHVRSTGDLRLSAELSTPGLLVLLRDDDPSYDAQGRVQIPVSLLDPATGDLQLDAFTIGNP